MYMCCIRCACFQERASEDTKEVECFQQLLRDRTEEFIDEVSIYYIYNIQEIN